jgi:hypothetical protein
MPMRARELRALGLVASAARSIDQTVPIEHGVHGADGRQLDLAVLAADLLPVLRSALARVLALELQDQVLDLEGQ